MLRIPCDDAVKPGTNCAFYHDGIFIVIVFDCNRILAVDAQGINQLEERIQLCHYLSGFCIDIFLTGKLLAGKEMNVGNVSACDHQSSETLFQIPRFAPGQPKPATV